jgi:hypothetical protein
VTGVPLEPRTTVAAYDPASKQYTLYSGTGRGVAKARLDLAHALRVPAERVRVLCEEMGGSLFDYIERFYNGKRRSVTLFRLIRPSRACFSTLRRRTSTTKCRFGRGSGLAIK